MDEIEAGDVVFANNEGVEYELKNGGRYLVEEVIKHGKHYQDWVVKLRGVIRKGNGADTFMYSRFTKANMADPANVVYASTVAFIMAPLKRSYFDEEGMWLAYKEAAELLIPSLKGKL